MYGNLLNNNYQSLGSDEKNLEDHNTYEAEILQTNSPYLKGVRECLCYFIQLLVIMFDDDK